MELQTEQRLSKPVSSRQSETQKLPIDDWAIEQVGILAAAFGEPVTAERLKIYASDLADLSREQLQTALTRARLELKFFPKIAELRELSGAPKQEQREGVEAHAAFALVVRHLEREGVMAGMKSLPERVQFAVRQCGGLELFNRRLQIHYGDDLNPGKVEDRSYVFLVRDFDEAYKNFPLHGEMLPQLTAKGLTALPQPVRLFLGNPDPPKPEKTKVEIKSAPIAPPILAKMRTEPTEAELRDRKEILRQQAQQILSQRKSAAGADKGEEEHPADLPIVGSQLPPAPHPLEDALRTQ